MKRYVLIFGPLLLIAMAIGFIVGGSIVRQDKDRIISAKDAEISALKEEISSYRLTFDHLGIGPRLKK